MEIKTNKKAKPWIPSLSLFTGAGGLDIGLNQAGFRSKLCIELDTTARHTLRLNQPAVILAEPADIHSLSMTEISEQSGLDEGDVGLLFGGPPCQPFSKAALWNDGKSLRLRDPRARTLHAMLDAVEHFLPEVFVLENVVGFATKGRYAGASFVQRRLKEINAQSGAKYRPNIIRINAVDFGAPQSRERIFLIAERSGKNFKQPTPTHFSPDIATSNDTTWRTAWDAIGHLADAAYAPALDMTGKWAGLLPSIPEGNNYLWHTERGGGQALFGWRRRYWTFLLKLAKNLPSWTIQASPGPATGPFHWANRRLSIAELAALQTFPAGHIWEGNYRDLQTQIGNAVPPVLGEIIGNQIRRQFYGIDTPLISSLIPAKRDDCPAPEKVKRVPKRYTTLELDITPHPGTGFGPRAVEISI